MTRLHMLAAVIGALALSPLAARAAPGAAGHSHDSEAAAYGKPGDSKKSARTIEVSMREGDGTMEFVPNRIEVKKGEQIRFALRNAGELEHEFVLGTVEENRKHAAAMEKNPDMEHADPNAERLAPKKAGELLWQFTKAGEFEFACLIPGHLQAGMKGTIVVK